MIAWENKRQFVKVWLGVWAGLAVLWCCVPGLHLIGAAVTAVLVADFLLMIYDIVTPKQYIKDANKKAVLITGCDTGFGNQLASRLASLGFRVYAGCLETDCAGAKQLERNDKILVLKINVTKQEDLDLALETVKKDLKEKSVTLWSVVNNAGIGIMGEVETHSMADFRRAMEINAFGPVMVTKTFLPLMRAAKQGGRIATTVSQAGRYTMYGYTAYAMSKYPMVAFSDGLRLEMKKWNISVHTIEPSAYRTEFNNFKATRDMMEKINSNADEEVREAYGKEYLAEQVDAICRYMEKAKPALHEVVDDMVDAVAGTNPKINYVPNSSTKVFVRFRQCVPCNFLDHIAWITAPKVQPAQAVRR